MIEKLLKAWNTCASKVTQKRKRAPKTSMRIVYLYGAGLVCITLLLIAGWLWQWQATGNPDLPVLISIFKEYTAATVVAAVTFLSVFHVDKNGDGRPDAAEIQSKKEGTK